MVISSLYKSVILELSENAFREVLVEPGAFLGDAAEFQIQACNERILLIADAAFTFAVSQLGKQLVVIESRLDSVSYTHLCIQKRFIPASSQSL